MTAASVLNQALSDGLVIALTDSGKLRLTGKASVVQRWRELITVNRDEILELVRARARPASKRERFAFTAEKLDDLRANGFPDARVVYATQDGDAYGQPLLPHEGGVPLHADELPTVPAAGCMCSSCRRLRKPPSKMEQRRRQQGGGSPFNLTSGDKFRQPSTYRPDLSEPRWPTFVERLKSRQVRDATVVELDNDDGQHAAEPD